MACNRETSTDGTTPSPPPVCGQNPDPFVPCCNKNCQSFGCAATMNLCSKCYSERILNKGSGVDAPVYTAVMRPDADGTDEANPCRGVDDDSRQRIEVVPLAGGLTGVDKLALREALDESNQLTSGIMNRSGTVSDFQAIVRSVAETSTAGVVCSSTSDLPQQPIPSPLSLSSESPRSLSPVRPRQVETKLSLLPLPRQHAVNRCMRCRKRVGLVGFKCRCGDIFCALHRYSDRHDCSFDYKAAGRAAISKENPVVKASKIVKI